MPRYLHRALVLFVLISACASSPPLQRVAMPGPPSGGGEGIVSLVFSRKTSGVIVSLDGHLVVEGATLKRLRIEGVSSGYVELAIAADGVERQMRVWVEGGRETSVPIGAAPMPPRQSPVVTAGLSVLALLISRSVSSLLF